jgi:hypothetical protein
MDEKLKQPPIQLPEDYVFTGGGNKQIQQKLQQNS